MNDQDVINKVRKLCATLCVDGASISSNYLLKNVARAFGVNSLGDEAARNKLSAKVMNLARKGYFPFVKRGEPAMRYGREYRPYLWFAPTAEHLDAPAANPIQGRQPVSSLADRVAKLEAQVAELFASKQC
jgi:hypothetical protein